MRFPRTIFTAALVSLAFACESPQTQPVLATPLKPGTIQLSAPASVVAGACAPAQVLFVDAAGAALKIAFDASISLSGDPGVLFFSDSACSASLTSVAAPSGATSATFYLSGTIAGNKSIQASGILQGGTTASQASAQVAISPAAAHSLTFGAGGATAGVAGAALAPALSVSAFDAYGNLATTTQGSIALSAFTDPACKTAGGGVLSNGSVPLASGSAKFAAVQYTAAGALYLGASLQGAVGVQSPCSAVVTIAPGAISAANSALKVGAATSPVGSAVGITATLQDAFHNPIPGVAVTLAVNGSAQATLSQPASATDAGGNASGGINSTAFGLQTISIQAPAGLSTVMAQVTFTDAQIQFSIAGPLDFGPVNIGATADRTVSVLYNGNVAGNVGGGAATISATTSGTGFVFKGGTYPGTGGTCGAQISANCVIVVTFAPKAAGPASENLNLSYTPVGAGAAKVDVLSLTGRSMTGVASLAWSAYPGEQDGFLIEHSTDNVTFTQVLQVPGTATTAQVTGLATATTHFFRIRSFNAAGDSGYTTSVSAAIP
jgi:hypothetical protein